jgi:arylsulfatase A-like enzyme
MKLGFGLQKKLNDVVKFFLGLVRSAKSGCGSIFVLTQISFLQHVYPMFPILSACAIKKGSPRASQWMMAFVVAVLWSIIPSQVLGDQKPPNVVFILADDLGWRDLSGEGSSFYESPNVDRIAREGMRFTQGYATCQVCSPSRASLMTGKYPARLNITDWIGAAEGEGWKRNTRLLPATYEHQLPTQDITLAEAFQSAGYKTFFAGKWHLGGEGSFPEDHGFDINVGGHHRGSPPGGFFSPYDNPKMESGPKGEYLPLRLGRETSEFIEKHQDEPFFAYLSFYMVHAPLQTTEALWDKYRKKAEGQEKPKFRFIVDRTSPVRQVQDNPLYGGMVEAMDTAVGMVLETLDRLGLEENTIIVFTSDNGGVSAGDGKATSNLPLRGGKGRQWEGGIREPYYIKWPGVAPAGASNETPVIGTDFFPTLLEMAGICSLADQHVDGVSLVPLLKGGEIAERNLFWHYPHYGNQGGEPSSIIRSGDWKLIYYYEDRRKELYHLPSDPVEHNDIAASEPGKVIELTALLEAWLIEVDARFPVTNKNFDSAAWDREQDNIRNQQLPNLERQHAGFLDPNWSPGGGWWEVTGN